MTLSFTSLKELYKDVPKTNKSQETIQENLADYSNHDDCYYKKYNINMESCAADKNKQNKSKTQHCEKFSNYTDEENKLLNPKLNNKLTNMPNYSDYNDEDNCIPIQSPPYKYPISEGALNKGKKAIEHTLTENKPVGYEEFNNKTKKRNQMENIKPYEDDDMDQYLNINNFKDALDYPLRKKMEQNKKKLLPEDDEDTEMPVKKSQNKDDKDEEINPNRFHNKTSELTSLDKSYLLSKNNTTKDKNKDITEEKNKLYNNYINIGLFIFIGIAVILLCDQIAELAINIGMRKTAKMLEPFLDKLQEINNQQAMYQLQSQPQLQPPLQNIINTPPKVQE